jgi:hypothetical protein
LIAVKTQALPLRSTWLEDKPPEQALKINVTTNIRKIFVYLFMVKKLLLGYPISVAYL